MKHVACAALLFALGACSKKGPPSKGADAAKLGKKQPVILLIPRYGYQDQTPACPEMSCPPCAEERCPDCEGPSDLHDPWPPDGGVLQ